MSSKKNNQKEVKANVNDEKREVKTKEFLTYKFTEKELKDISEEMARNYQEKLGIENEKKAVNAEFAAKIESKSALIESLATKINNKQEHRYIDCVIKMNTPKPTLKTLVRVDTGEIIWERNMSAEEMQLKLSLENEENISSAMVEHNNPALD